MMKSAAPSKIDAVDIGEMKIDFTSGQTLHGQMFPAMAVSAKYALVVSDGPVRVGAGTCTSWSEATYTKVRELIASMEADICTSVFGEAPTSDGGALANDPNPDGVPGL